MVIGHTAIAIRKSGHGRVEQAVSEQQAVREDQSRSFPPRLPDPQLRSLDDDRATTASRFSRVLNHRAFPVTQYKHACLARERRITHSPKRMGVGRAAFSKTRRTLQAAPPIDRQP